MTNDAKKTVGKVIFGCVGFAMLVVFCLFASSAIFLAWHKQPIADARPFLIFDYWAQFGTIAKYKTSFYVSWAAPWFLLIGAAVFIFSDQKKRSLHGDARFAKETEIKAAGLLNSGSQSILVGKYKHKYLQYSGYQFVMIAAPTRSGKGVGIVIPNCLNYSDSLVVLDIKLENFDISAGFRAKCGQKVYLFSPFDETGRTHRYNPLEYISDDRAQRISDIQSIAYAFYPDPEGDAFWASNARNLFIGLCLYLIETPELPTTIGEMLRQASGKGKPLKEYITDIINERAVSDKPFSADCTDSLNRFIGNSDNTLSGILSSFNSPLMIWANPRIDAATSTNDFDLREVRKQRMTIYIGIQPNKLSDAKVLVNLLFDQLYNLNTKELPQQNPELKYQCLSLLDEFTSIGKVNIIANSISYMAGYNMRILTIIQNKSQLVKVYTESGATTLMANHALMVMYAPSPVVQSDATEYSEMLGYQTVKGVSKSKQLSGKTSQSQSESDQRRALMLPQEIRELGKDNEVVLLENTKPILCKKIQYYKDPNFMSRMNLPPPEVPVIDVGLHIAKIENRTRDLSMDELETGGFDISKIVGLDRLPTLLDDSDESINSFVDDLFEHVLIIADEEAGPDDEEKNRLILSMFTTGDEDEDDEGEEEGSTDDDLLDDSNQSSASITSLDTFFNDTVDEKGSNEASSTTHLDLSSLDIPLDTQKGE